MFVLIWVTLLFAVRSSNTHTDVKEPKIPGETIKQGVNLTCSADGSPLCNDTGMANDTFVTPYVTAPRQNDTLTTEVNVAVLSPKMLNSSGCRNQSGVLTCMCVSQGFPLPTIKWMLNHTVHSIITTVSNHTINSTITLNVKDKSSTVVCISTSHAWEVKKIIIDKEEEEKDYLKTILRIVTQLETVIAFFIGILLSSVTCCLMRTCQRKKWRIKENLSETGGLEMVTSDADLLIYTGHVVEDDQAVDQEAAEAGGAVAAGKSDVEYSNLDFSLIKDREDATGETPGTTETEYAEIKKAMTGQDGESIEEDEETGHCAPVVEEEEDVALYSTVNDMMDDSFNEDSVG